MLIFGEKLIDTPVLSLQTGTELARTEQAIIDPSNLHIVGYKLSGRLLSNPNNSYIRTNEIREYAPLGLIVNSNDDILTEDDIITQKQIYELGFNPVGLKVIDEHKSRLGKVVGYTVNIPSFTILQLRVAKSGIYQIVNTDKLIHRSQIVEINNTEIIVKATTKKLKDVTPLINTESIINPFRTNRPSQETSGSLSADSTS